MSDEDRISPHNTVTSPELGCLTKLNCLSPHNTRTICPCPGGKNNTTIACSHNTPTCCWSLRQLNPLTSRYSLWLGMMHCRVRNDHILERVNFITSESFALRDNMILHGRSDFDVIGDHCQNSLSLNNDEWYPSYW